MWSDLFAFVFQRLVFYKLRKFAGESEFAYNLWKSINFDAAKKKKHRPQIFWHPKVKSMENWFVTIS